MVRMKEMRTLTVFIGIYYGMGNISGFILQAGVVSPTEGKGNGNSGIPKAQTPEENKRPDTLLNRFERRDNLKKANTLPTSVTGAMFLLIMMFCTKYTKVKVKLH